MFVQIWTCRLFECLGGCSSPNGGLVLLNVAGGGEISCWGPWVAKSTLLRVASALVLYSLNSFLFVNARLLFPLVGCVVPLGRLWLGYPLTGL